MSKRRRIRKQRKTLLVVGEGHTECAFLNYLKTLYCRGSASVSVKVVNAHGKGPENVLQTAVSTQKRASYDDVVAVLDTDIPWTETLKKEARDKNIQLIGNSPCIEALFLQLLNEPVPAQTEQCKAQVAALVTADLLDKRSYASWCTKEKLETLRKDNEGLDSLLSLYEGGF